MESLEIPMNNVFRTLQAYLGSAYVNLFNKFNQSYQVYVQAAAPYRLSPEDIEALYVRNNKWRNGAPGHPHDRQAHPGVRTPHPLQPLSRGAHFGARPRASAPARP